jgi:hypothetical protein
MICASVTVSGDSLLDGTLGFLLHNSRRAKAVNKIHGVIYKLSSFFEQNRLISGEVL